MKLRAPEPADEPFLAHARRPDIAGEFNFFDEPAGPPLPADVGRMISPSTREHRSGRSAGTPWPYRSGRWHDVVLFGRLRDDDWR